MLASCDASPATLSWVEAQSNRPAAPHSHRARRTGGKIDRRATGLYGPARRHRQLGEEIRVRSSTKRRSNVRTRGRAGARRKPVVPPAHEPGAMLHVGSRLQHARLAREKRMKDLATAAG